MKPKTRHSEDDLDSDLIADTERHEPADVETGEDSLVRLNKFLASQGVASRRKCDELIAAGHVSVDGEVVRELGLRIDPSRQEVEVDGRIFKPEGTRKRYYLLNKPRGVVCTNEEREIRPRAVDLITDARKGRVFTVGRLDEESEGLILITNDGDFAQRVQHPRYGVEKTYEVDVFGKVEDESLRKIREGVHLAEGRTSGARVLVKSRRAELSRLTVTLGEGMNREIRRVFARIGHKVLRLRRVRIGPLGDRGLKPGRWRELTREEIVVLQKGEAAEPMRKKPRRRTDRPPRKAKTHSGRPGIVARMEKVEPLAARRARIHAEREQFGARARNPQRSRADKPQRSRADKPQRSRADKPQRSRADKPQRSRADKPQRSRAESPRRTPGGSR
jgi:23S rRNA pseudouridine2605 synthase